MIGFTPAHGTNQRIEHELLHGFISPEWIVIMCRKKRQISRAPVAFHNDRSRKATVDGQDRTLCKSRYSNFHFGVCKDFEALNLAICRVTIEERKLERNSHWQLVGLSRSIRNRLLKLHHRFLRGCVMHQTYFDMRRSGLRIPEPELAEVDATGLFHCKYKVLARHGLAVMSRKIKVATGAEFFRSEQRKHHADDLGALVVDRRRVEVCDFDVGFGTHGMRERTCILLKLRSAKHTHVFYPRYRRGTLVGRKALVPKDREALFQRKLEPVSAGNAIARPVVKIFMRHNPQNAVIVHVRRRIRICQNIA